jgi:hypothetical protein
MQKEVELVLFILSGIGISAVGYLGIKLIDKSTQLKQTLRDIEMLKAIIGVHKAKSNGGLEINLKDRHN